MKKTLSIIMLAVIASIVIFGTVCLFLGNFEGAFGTLPFLFVYYVWVVAMKRRESPQEADDHDPGNSGPGR